jgi:hypothetical protein
VSRTGNCKIFLSPGINAKESIPGLIKILKNQALSAWAISVLMDIRNPFSEEYKCQTNAKVLMAYKYFPHKPSFFLNNVENLKLKGMVKNHLKLGTEQKY